MDVRRNLLMANSLNTEEIVAGDIAYYDGEVKLISKDKYNTSLGTAIGVVVIPPNFVSDGKCRIGSLQAVDSSGNAVSSYSGINWSLVNTDTSLTNYDRMPITDNLSSTTTGSKMYGAYLPSDNFNGAQSFVDPKAKYIYSSDRIPSPYLGDDNTLNPAYCEEISGYNNVLSDFNGLSNTQTLVGLGTDYVAANAAWNYNDGVSNLQWYLPAAGELGFMMVRFKEINNTISMLGGVSVLSCNYLWSSTEYTSKFAYNLNTYGGNVARNNKDSTNCVCPFAAF